MIDLTIKMNCITYTYSSDLILKMAFTLSEEKQSHGMAAQSWTADRPSSETLSRTRNWNLQANDHVMKCPNPKHSITQIY